MNTEIKDTTDFFDRHGLLNPKEMLKDWGVVIMGLATIAQIAVFISLIFFTS